MQSRYTIVCEPHLDLVRITIGGFFQPEDVARLDADRAAAYARLRCAPHQHVTLCDASAMKIQPQNVVAAFAQLTADPRYRSRRLALVVAASLAGMQAQRVTDRDTARFFSDAATARAWLLAG